MTREELAAIRMGAGLTEVELARRVGIGRHAVSYWENKPRVDLCAGAVVRRAEVLDLPKPPARGYRASWLADADRQADTTFHAVLAARKTRETEHANQRRVICGAKTRKGMPCRCKSEQGRTAANIMVACLRG